MIEVTMFAGQNWLITPAGRGVSELAPKPADQQFVLLLTGVTIPNFPGQQANDWHRDTLNIRPDLRPALDFAINRWAVPRPAGAEGNQYTAVLSVEEWAPYAGLSSVFDPRQAPDAGFAVDVWRPLPFGTATDVNHQSVGQIFSGIGVDVAVRDTAAVLHRVSYAITLYGRIRFLPVVIE